MRLDANDYRGKASGVRIGQVRTNTKRPDGGVGAPGAVMRGHLAASSERGQRAARAVQRGRKGGAYTIGPDGLKHYIGKGK